MVVLHASWLDDQLLIWGESSPSTTPVRIPTKSGSPLLWGCTHAELVAALTAVLTIPLPNTPVSQCVVWLPQDDNRPVPSRLWLRRFAKGQPQLIPCSINTLSLAIEPLMDLLAAAAESQNLSRGVVAGNDLRAWADLMRYAGAITTRRQFLPTLQYHPQNTPENTADSLVAIRETNYESRWVPALDRHSQQLLNNLATRLPGAALALSTAADAPPLTTPHTAAAAFLTDIVDRLTRLSITTTLSRSYAARGHYACAHDAWTASLRSESRVIRWENNGDLANLLNEIEKWRRPLDLERHAEYSLVITLTEPDSEEEPWQLQCSLLASSGLQLTWHDFWHAPTTSTSEREALLLSLGQAALLAPLLDDINADGTSLSTAEAHRFMRHDAPLLEAAGFTVSLPAWWQRRSTTIQLMAFINSGTMPAASNFSLASLVDVDWQIAIGNEAITEEELVALANQGQELIRFRNQWIEVDPNQVNDALRLWRKRRKEARNANDAIRLMLGIDRDNHGLTVAGINGSGWIDELLRCLKGDEALALLDPPADFKATLRPYQERGFAWLAFLRQWKLGACLADDMGLGKTVQALALLAREYEHGERRPTLLVCPTSILTNWQREAKRFTPNLPLYLHHGPERSVGSFFVDEAASAALVITSYSLLYRDYRSLRQIEWAGIILDEAQNIKNPDTRQAQVARALQADFRIALTGTPIENHVGDLWSIMDFLNPGLLGSRSSFRDSFALPIKTGIDLTASDRLRQMTAPFVLRRLKTDRDVISDLPEKHETSVYCSLTTEQASLYQGVLDELTTTIRDKPQGIDRRGLVLATITRLKQICNHPAQFLAEESPRLTGRSGKLDRLCEMIEEVVAVGDAALVFTQYATMGSILQHHLQQEFSCFVPLLHGGTPRKERDNMINAFTNETGPAIFILSLRAGGTGLNLTRASHVFHFDRWWNPAVENQATDRAFRIGQTRNVMVYKFICAGTMEERIEAMIREKTALADEVIISGEAWLTGLDDTALTEALALSQEAVSVEELP